MDLQEHIRKVLREETVDDEQSNKLTGRRLLYIADEYLEDN